MKHLVNTFYRKTIVNFLCEKCTFEPDTEFWYTHDWLNTLELVWARIRSLAHTCGLYCLQKYTRLIEYNRSIENNVWSVVNERGRISYCCRSLPVDSFKTYLFIFEDIREVVIIDRFQNDNALFNKTCIRNMKTRFSFMQMYLARENNNEKIF